MKKVLVLGSGPIIIGQGAEFDYSGTQACLALKEEGYHVILVNNNPATIMTDKEIVDTVYFEPLTKEFLIKIIKKEQPEFLLPTLGGQTGLNLATVLEEEGILSENNIKIIGTSMKTIQLAEDRQLFKSFLESIDEPVIESKMVTTVADGVDFVKSIGFPVVVRPAYTLGGTGGGFVHTEEELIAKIKSGTNLSIVNQVLIEKSVKGYKEIEYEVMRDSNGTCICVCNMENIDPVGVHTGDSIVVAPSQTLSDYQYQMLRSASLKIVDQLGIEGGCNVQLALDPESNQYYVIEVNPRVSRSSALASKATGYPIAKVATKIALGYSLHEIKNDITNKTYAAFEPALDYCVVKIPRWPFDKFVHGDNSIGTMMKATGEVMAIGDNFESALLKAIRSLELNQFTLKCKKASQLLLDELLEKIQNPCTERLFYISELMHREVGILLIHELTGIDLYFLNKIKNIVILEKEITNMSFERLTLRKFKVLKKYGFSDEGIASLMMNTTLKDLLDYKKDHKIKVSYQVVDTCAGEFEATSPYYYSAYGVQDEVDTSNNNKVLVLGSGPIRIGQGVEFDYSTVKCLMELKKLGYESIVINNNPETVSTDYNMSDKLYFEPITKEDVYNVILKEKPIGVILQFGGQTSVKISKFLSEMGVPILGTSYNGIDLVENRDKFVNVLANNNIDYPKGAGVKTIKSAKKLLKYLNFPLLVRPDYVLGGQGMKIFDDENELIEHLKTLFNNNHRSVLIDEYLPGIELEVDAIVNVDQVYIPGIMEHLEKAGIHSGDSVAIYPSTSVDQSIKEEIYDITKKISKSIQAKGLMNIQLIYYKEKLYVLEVNPRASRTVPFISKVTDTPVISLAVQSMLSKPLSCTGIKKEKNLVAIKGPIFSMEKITDSEMALGPEMKSTGEILSIEKTLSGAMFKNFISQDKKLYSNKSKKVAISIANASKESYKPVVNALQKLGFEIYATQGSYEYYSTNYQIHELTELTDDFIMLINSPNKKDNSITKGFTLRRTALENNIPVFTTLNTIKALIKTYESKVTLNTVNVYTS